MCRGRLQKGPSISLIQVVIIFLNAYFTSYSPSPYLFIYLFITSADFKNYALSSEDENKAVG